MQKLTQALILLLAVVVLSACSQSESDPVLGKSGVGKESYGKEHFSGPYAGEIFDLYQSTKDPVVASLVEDSSLSDQDMNDVKQIFSHCMEEKGWAVLFTLKGMDVSSAGSKDPDWSKETSDESICNEKTSFPEVQILYNLIRSNPEHLDRDKIIAQCLVEKKLLPEGYTADEYRYDSGKIDGKMHGVFDSAMSGETTPEWKIISACQNDPLS